MANLLRTVAIVGIDGSGKSTQAILLRQDLSRVGTYVVMIHPLGWKLLAPFVPARAASSSHREVFASRSVLGRMVALAELADIGLYLWLTHLRSLLAAVTRGRPTWIVSDRSAADVLIKQRRRGVLPEALLERWYRVVPRPQLTVWLHTDPEVAAGRDGEFPTAYYQDFHALYEQASEQFGWEVIKSAARTVDGVRSEIERILDDRFGSARSD